MIYSPHKRRESQAARDLATVLRDTCRPYVLQMRNGFNCQNHACFPGIYLSILHKSSSTGFKQRRPAEFQGKKSVKDEI